MGAYDGRSRADLQAQLTALLKAYAQLAAGQMVASANYSQSDGSRSVTFRQTDLGTLDGLISKLQEQLGIVRRARRQIRFVYR
ncbi:gpW family head-tail joining protein [Burkholderia seminalis]|uniref:gpW family head-tail joining protein n=1 Tax=Burkholderia seminalis TaxID=488731 RepID=UPI001453A0CE|nr:gpW family head-tail joining protein [Burkholderia seminalis]MCA8430046.1 gpW family protein [Burkholderia seminalis]VWB16185.1 phage head-tail adapter protein [Burkholderia seminalis]